MPVFRLAIASPLRRLFDYSPPPELDSTRIRQLRPGLRVRVPFGAREVAGVLVEVAEETTVPQAKLRAAITLIDDNPLLSETLLELCGWAAGYYKYPLGEILSAALPTRSPGSEGSPLDPAACRRRSHVPASRDCP